MAKSRLLMGITRHLANVAKESITLLSSTESRLGSNRKEPQQLPVELVAKLYPSDYKVPKFQKYDDPNGSSKSRSYVSLSVWVVPMPTILTFA